MPVTQRWREEWGARFQFRLFIFLQVQALAAALLAVSMMLAAHNPAPFPRALDVAGIVVLITAVAGEGIADEQLRRFKKNPAKRGRVCDAGLWGWSRHPNYFFEWFGWVAYPLLAIDTSGGGIGAGWRFPARLSCTFCWYMSRVFRYWNNRC